MRRLSSPFWSLSTAALLALAGGYGCGEGSDTAPVTTPLTEEEPTAPIAAIPVVETETPPSPVAEATESDSSLPPEVETTTPSFLGEPDAPRLEALRTGEIVEIERGRGGRSVGFRLTLADGTRGYFKPEQEFSGAHWYAEIAAYYLDRALGLGRVPPTVSRRLEWEPLRRVAATDSRVSEVIVQPDGTVRGAFIWWIPERLPALRTGVGWERWVRTRGGIDLTPYQRPSEYRADIRRNRELLDAMRAGQPADFSSLRGEGPRAGEPDTPDRSAELSDMILFDYLTSNVDRWGGDNTNIRTRGPGGPLIFLDNGAGFWPNAHLSLMDTRLRMLQRFRRTTVDAIRGFDLEVYRAQLAGDPLGPILSERLLEGLGERIERLTTHVNTIETRFGDDVWM